MDTDKSPKHPPSSLPPMILKPNNSNLVDMHNKAEKNCDKQLKTSPAGIPDEKVGYGILRSIN
ncbi:MAG: hypothetical protein PVJ54_07390 [Desulfobacterales bacterium]|jgi:hypothetical protein